MIYGPILPLTREGIRRLLWERPDLLERGLRCELADLDLSRGSLGAVDALCCDAASRPLLLFVTEPGDLALAARVGNAAGFFQRNGQALPRTLPQVEARLAQPCRLLVVGAELGDAQVEDLRRLGLPELEICVVEPFRVGSDDHLVLRRLPTVVGAAAPPPAPAVAPPANQPQRQLWEQLLALLARIDPAVQIDGDRYSRQVRCRDRLLCEFWLHGDHVEAALADAPARVLAHADDVRAFVDAVLRSLLGRRADAVASLDGRTHAAGAAAARSTAAATAAILPGMSLETLRASLSASRLSREEYSALSELPDGGEQQRS